MCQACLALARRRTGAPGWPLAAGAAGTPGHFAGAAEWADEAEHASEAATSPASEDDEPPIDARRS